MKKKLKNDANNGLMLMEQISYEMQKYLNIKPSMARLFAIGLITNKLKEVKNEQ